MKTETPTVPVNIFAVGDVLNPHIEVNGKCRTCNGEAMIDKKRLCPTCNGTGIKSFRVRLATLLTTVGPALEYITTIDEPVEKGTDHA